MKAKRLSTLKILFLLIVWFIIAEIIYNVCIYNYFAGIVIIYIVLTALSAIIFLLLNGGVRPLIKADREKEERVHKKYLEDKRKENKRKNKREKYRRFTVSSEKDSDKAKEIENNENSQDDRPNLLNLSIEDREYYSKLVLIFAVPLLAVVFVDYMILFFNISF